ncbi:TonB-dependent receptor [Fulvivirgaceae bacterium BMA12]|uniref:TonB-dependent receptor n=1 Tax=Agaribacillus aureus TaxID=3051825 RepID=A0ABT8LAY3_9BACT|nr:TonB-dependent receptor [Fulvivirgaceae bacterium BMA12]
MEQFVKMLVMGLIVGSMLTPTAPAQSMEDLIEISLEDLMNIKITSASKKEEKAFDAPSVITTITAKDIETFGGTSLYEILERSAGFYGLSSFVFRKNAIGLRGDLPTHINPRILFLIDGRPFRESVFGGQNVGILTSFPVYSIKQIEIIRGPGSVLYGSNAYVGVVNIITKEAAKPELNVRGGGGSFGTGMLQIDGGTSIGELKVNGGFNYLKSTGWRFSDSTRTRGPNRQYAETDFGEDILAANLQFKYKGFSLSGFYGANDLAHITPATSIPGIYKSRRAFIDLGYTGDIIPDVYSISANITYNNINDNFDNGFFNDLSSVRIPTANDYVFEITNFLTINEKFEVTVGGSLYHLSGEWTTNDTSIIIPSYSDQWFHGYLQADYKPMDWLKLVFGGQLNKVAGLDVNFVPRLAAVASFKSGLGAKIMYGQAFRAPYPAETDIFTPPTLIGDPNLKPENISTFETQVFYAKDKTSVAVSYFNSKQTDLVTRIPNTDPSSGASLTYTNLGELKSQGFEIEAKYSLTNTIYLDGSYAFQTNEDDSGNRNVTRLPQHMVKLGAAMDVKSYLNLGVFNSFYSSPFDNDSSVEGLDQLSAFNWLTARLDVKVDKLANLKYPKIGLVFEGVNLLDQKVYNPEIVFKNYNAVRNKPGLGINVTAYVKF